MTSIRNWLAGTALTAGALLSAGALLTAASAADTTPAATTTPAPNPDWHHHHHHHGFMYRKLGLTDTQIASIKSLHQAAEPQMKALFQQMQANSVKLATLAPNDPQYMNTVREVSEANAPLKAQLEQQRAALHQKIYSTVLTSTQQSQFLQMKAQMQQRMQQRMQQQAATPAS